MPSDPQNLIYSSTYRRINLGRKVDGLSPLGARPSAYRYDDHDDDYSQHQFIYGIENMKTWHQVPES